MLKSTTAGTMLAAIEWKGLLGMNSRKLNGWGCSSSVVLKNDADCQFGKLSGKIYKTAKVNAQISRSRLPTRTESRTASWYFNLPSPDIRVMMM
jgi:hypothetical protein